MESRYFYYLLIISLETTAYVSGTVKDVSSQYFSLGYCPTVLGVQNLNITKFMGTWYEVEKYQSFFEITTACVKINNYENDDGTFNFNIHLLEKLTGKSYDMPGITRIHHRSGKVEALVNLLVTWSPIPTQIRVPYVLIDTDYESYAIKYSCRQIGPLNRQLLWILSRKKFLSKDSKESVSTILSKLGIDITRIVESDQQGCPT